MRNLWQSKGIPLRGLMAVCLAFVMILSMLPYAFAITAGATETSPNVTITAVGVDDTYVELGINVQAQSNGFRSVGAVLTYDPTLLTPVDWAAQPASVNVTEQPADADTYTAEEARTDWNNVAVPMGTKGPDILSGKTALVFHKKVSDTAKAGYLYLSAEAPKLVAGATEVDGVLTGGWNQALPELSPDKAGDTANGVPYYTPKDDAKLETPVEQSVVVRFKLKGDDMSAALASIDLAKGNAAKGAPINDESGVAYFHNDKGESLAVNVRILRAVKGTTYFTGGGGGSAGTEGIVAVTAFDWDGTMLGSFIFATDNDPAKQKENADAALAEFTARTDIAAKLKSHAGYDFLAWVKNEDNIPTSYGARVAPNDRLELGTLDLDEDDIMDFSTLKESTTVNAAYTTNSECITGADLSAADAEVARRYTTSIDSYNRFGTGQSFSVKIKVERGKVPRYAKGALRVRMVVDDGSVNGVSVYTQYELSGADVEFVEVAPYAQSATSGKFTGVSLVEWAVIDTYEYADWVGAAQRTLAEDCRTEASFTVTTVGTGTYAVWDQGSYPLNGIVASINDTLASYHELVLADPGTSPTNTNMAAITPAILRSIGIPPSSTNLRNLRNAVYNGWVTAGAKDLTYAELFEIASGTAYTPPTE